MAAIDIREDVTVDSIIFDGYSAHKRYLNGYRLEREGSYIRIVDGHTPMYIHASSVDNFIRALQKAVELGWTE